MLFSQRLSSWSFCALSGSVGRAEAQSSRKVQGLRSSQSQAVRCLSSLHGAGRIQPQQQAAPSGASALPVSSLPRAPLVLCRCTGQRGEQGTGAAVSPLKSLGAKHSWIGPLPSQPCSHTLTLLVSLRALPGAQWLGLQDQALPANSVERSQAVASRVVGTFPLLPHHEGGLLPPWHLLFGDLG